MQLNYCHYANPSPSPPLFLKVLTNSRYAHITTFGRFSRAHSHDYAPMNWQASHGGEKFLGDGSVHGDNMVGGGEKVVIA